ncbi:hypothetical protein Franean1_1600 [Parafrankia sp. EAN1pec]|uniref:hypothetical protein n=1 Tax=Parafrankia sp. (strain EAN1pec) TaxID=298653 RepID=UPI0000544BEF|nr:hypothetical protein Franean1_1600 [Frankia sp. EAN1pec]
MADTDAGPGFELHLRTAMASAAQTVQQPPGLARQVVERGRRHRRRRTLAAAVALAVAAVGAVVIPQVLPEERSAMYPADTSVLSPPLDTAYGVDVHWLPDGYGVRYRQGQDLQTPGPQQGQFDVTTFYNKLPVTENFSAYSKEFRPYTPTYQVDVRRGRNVDLEAEQRWEEKIIHAADPSHRERTTTAVRGHSAYLFTREVFGKPQYWLTWSPEPTVAVTVSGESMPDVRRIAESLVIGPPPPGPHDRDQASGAETAFPRVLTNGGDPRRTLDWVEGGDSLRAAMDEALRTNRETVESVRVAATGPVVFLSETEAMVGFSLDMRARESGVMVDSGQVGVARVVLTANGWRVNRQDYCTQLIRVLTCPPITIR